MERRNNGTGRIQLPEPKRMDTNRKHTRKETTRPNNSQGHHTGIETHKEPGCKASWEKRLKLETEIPWREIGRNIAHGIGTKKDTSSWFKNILHRAMFMYLKGITTTTRTIRCTSCGRSHEDWNHFWKCPKYKPIWKKLINLMNETEIAEESGKTHDYTQEWVYLGIRKDGKALNRGHALMHMLT